MSTPPLSGYRVIDMTAVVAGPYATQIIADLGADVIKIESPGGDLMRGAGKGKRHADMAPIYLTINRNKRSVCLDLKRESAREVMRRLLAGADAFVTNVRPQGLRRLGFDYEGVRGVRPDIVYVHLVGFGSRGRYAGRQAYDDLVQAASGIADLLPRTERGGDPRFLPSLIADKATGLHAVYGLLAALLHRERTGEGQFVEVPMLESLVSFNLVEHLYGHVHVPPTAQWGYTRVLTPNRRPFRTKDAFIAIMPYTDEHWPLFFELAGHAQMWDRWRNASIQDRTRHIDELYATIGKVTREKTTDEWMELLDAHNIPCMRINRLEDLPDDPHLRDVEFFEPHRHPTEGDYVSMRHPVRFSRNDTPLRLHPPRLGADSAAVLDELGFGEDEIRALIADGSVGEPAAGEDDDSGFDAREREEEGGAG
ncbi:MAG: CoA transferase [Myxococcales bacterium]|jgi:crotonobetainyl-CoA:carnitine CoA-transferase CaiB-like acyl-CoA transferase